MKNKKILIVEDEQIIAENLRFILNEYGYRNVAIAGDIEEALSLFQETAYHLVLMDINLGDKNNDGVDLISQLKELQSAFHFIYVTANADEKTVKKAAATNPSGYIVKPFVKESVYANVEMALSIVKEDENIFVFTDRGMKKQVAVSQIQYVMADGSYINVHLVSGEVLVVRQSIANFDDENKEDFIRIHRSIAVNKKHITAYSSTEVKVGEKKLTLGRVYKNKFMAICKSLYIY